MIIGISGWVNSGKDTCADFLVSQHGFKRESFASTVKDCLSVVFSWDRELLEGRSRSSRVWRETVDVWWANRLGIPNFTPRWAMQHWGTDLCRKHFHDSIWVASLEARIANTRDDVVITDVRFPNEAKVVKDNGGKLLWIKRGELPDWYYIAMEAVNGDENAIQILNSRDVHESEWSWIGSDFDYTINNDGSLDSLRQRLRDIVDK